MSVKFNTTLTNYAFEIAPISANPLAEFLAPSVSVASYAGRYLDFGDRQGYQWTDAHRGIGQKARRIAFDAQGKYFNLESFALDAAIDDIERKQAAVLDPLFLEKQKIKILTSTGNNSHAKAVLDIARTTVATGNLNLTDPNTSPTTTIDSWIAAMADNYGYPPNRLVLSFSSSVAIRNHPKIIARLVGVTDAAASMDVFRSMLCNPDIQILVSPFVLDQSKLGTPSANRKNQLAGDAYLFYSGAPGGGVFDASWMRTFRMDERGPGAVSQWRDNDSRSDIYGLDWYQEIKVVGPSLGMRFTVQTS